MIFFLINKKKKAGGKSGGAQPDPMFQISVAKTTHQSNIQYRTDSPVYEQGFTFLVNNPEVDTLHLKVFSYFPMRNILYNRLQK